MPTGTLPGAPRRMLRRPGVRVLAAVVLAVLVGGGVAAASISSSPNLPPVGPDRLIASVLRATARQHSMSGQLATHVDLGLPDIPAGLPQAEAGLGRLVSAVSGDHRLRLWSSPDGYRLDELLPTSELAFVLDKTGGMVQAWTWDSQTFTALHAGPVRRPAGMDRHPMGPGEMDRHPMGPAELLDPLALARRSLAAASPSTAVSVPSTATVAGRAAYVLQIRPRTAATLVGRIEVSVDAASRLPLRVAVFARGARAPALSVGFTSVRFGPVDPAVYRFTPPPGATVRRLGPGTLPALPLPVPAVRDRAGQAGPEGIHEYVRLFGQGWATVLAYRVPAAPAVLRPISGSLFSVRVVERPGGAWILAGAVPQSALARAARGLP